MSKIDRYFWALSSAHNALTKARYYLRVGERYNACMWLNVAAKYRLTAQRVNVYGTN